MKSNGATNLHLQNQRIQLENSELRDLIQSLHQHYNPGALPFDIKSAITAMRKQNPSDASVNEGILYED